jgi:hypothetical protein
MENIVQNPEHIEVDRIYSLYEQINHPELRVRFRGKKSDDLATKKLEKLEKKYRKKSS